MPTYAVFNTVNSDGIGDFSHFEDIMKALIANPLFKSVEFIPIVLFYKGGKESNYVRIHEKLKSLGIRFYYGKEDDHINFCSDKTCQELLKKVDQAIVISFDRIFDSYKPYLRENIPVKFISEHEGLTLNLLDSSTMFRPLGLSKECYGIKIHDIPRLQLNKAWEALTGNNSEFATKLLACTNSSDLETFHHKNLLVPAYFNKDLDFIPFLHIFGINSFPKNKDIVVYHSGSELVKFLSEAESISDSFKNTSIKQIEVIMSKNNSSIVIGANPHGTKTIKILSGFNLNDPAFDAIYHLAEIAGVSGDNTFERCVSMNVLPWYCSTNYRGKLYTLLTLKDITQLPDLNISNEARESFKIFFNPDEYYAHASATETYKNSNQRIREDKYNIIDFPKMLEAWPIVTAYLKQNKNFYNNLEDIILEKLPHIELQDKLSDYEKKLEKDLTNLIKKILDIVTQDTYKMKIKDKKLLNDLLNDIRDGKLKKATVGNLEGIYPNLGEAFRITKDKLTAITTIKDDLNYYISNKTESSYNKLLQSFNKNKDTLKIRRGTGISATFWRLVDKIKQNFKFSKSTLGVSGAKVADSLHSYFNFSNKKLTPNQKQEASRELTVPGLHY